MTDAGFVINLGKQLQAYPVLLLVSFALPLVLLAAWKQIYPTGRLLSLGFLPLIPTLGLVLPAILRLIVAMAVLFLPIGVWSYQRKALSGWTLAYTVLVGLVAVVSLAMECLPAVVVTDFCIVAAAVFDLCSSPRRRDFQVDRTCQKTASLKKPHPIKLTVDYTGVRPISLEIRDDIAQEFSASPPVLETHLPGRTRVDLHYKLSASRRGAFDQHAVYIKAPCRWKLWQRIIEKSCETSINVYPDMKQLAEYELLARTNRLSLVGVRRTRRIGQDHDFERLRDYTPDDNYKHIDWRSTARRQKLTVRDFQTSQSQRVIFMLDCGRMMTNHVGGITMLDHALNAILMLSYVALHRGDSVGLLCFSDRIHSFVPPRGGQRQMSHLLRASFDRFPELVESRYSDAFFHLSKHCRKRSLVILITNLIDEINANQIHRHLSTMVGRHLPLGVLLRDRELFSAADTNWRNDAELYRAAAAAEIVCWRNDVIRDMRHQGVLSLDVFPDEMTAPLINRYLEVKARHLL